MGLRQSALAVAVLGAVSALAWGQTEKVQLDEVEAGFRGAFGEDVEPAERVCMLEHLAKEHPDSRWADDALWVLGEAARQQGLHGRVAYYWQYLMGARPVVELERFTCGLEVYEASGLPQIMLYLEATGASYVPGTGVAKRDDLVLLDARPSNPVPMRVWEGLARAYEGLGEAGLALRAYRRAVEAAPASSPWSEGFQDSIERLERKLKVQRLRPDATRETEGVAAQTARDADAAETGGGPDAQPAGLPPRPTAEPASQAAAP